MSTSTLPIPISCSNTISHCYLLAFILGNLVNSYPHCKTPATVSSRRPLLRTQLPPLAQVESITTTPGTHLCHTHSPLRPTRSTLRGVALDPLWNVSCSEHRACSTASTWQMFAESIAECRNKTNPSTGRQPLPALPSCLAQPSQEKPLSSCITQGLERRRAASQPLGTLRPLQPLHLLH